MLGASSLATPTTAGADPPKPVVSAPAAPAVTVPAASLQTMDGSTVLWTRRADQQRRVASTIKLLNALVVRKNAELTDLVVVPKKAEMWDGGVGLVAGQKLTVNQLLQMMLVASANDAAEALAIHIGGSEANYVRMMNAEARRLNLTGTKAADPHGLGKREWCTANDLTVLAREVMKDPVLRRMVRQQFVMVPRPGGKPVKEKSTDMLLGGYSGIEGVKTGYTRASGYCFVSAAKRGNIELVGVVLGARSNPARFAETRKLLDWGFRHYRNRTIVSKDETAGAARVTGGIDASVTVHPAASFTALEFDGDPLTSVVQVATSTPAPVALGQNVGEVLVMQSGKVVATVPLIADRVVAAAPTPVEPAAVVGISNLLQRFVDFWGRVTGLARKSAETPAHRPSASARLAAKIVSP